jgi:hypothetical protein
MTGNPDGGRPHLDERVNATTVACATVEHTSAVASACARHLSVQVTHRKRRVPAARNFS